MGLEPTTGFPAPHFQSEPSAEAESNASICAPSTCDAKEKGAESAGDAGVTVEPSSQGQYWPADIDAGDGALEQVKSAWPFLQRNLRLAIAIASLVQQSTIDQDDSDQLAAGETDLTPF